MNASKKEICRLCYYETVDTTEIFSEKGTDFDYIGKINKYLYFSVRDDDALPKTVCWMCTQHLETFHRFYEKINDIQKVHLTEEEYDSVVLRPNYSGKTTDDVESLKKNDTIVSEDGNTYEILVISGNSDQKQSIDTEFEEFELLEVDNFDVNNEITENINVELPLENEETHSKQSEIPVHENQTIEIMETNEIENDNNAVISTRTRSRRKSRITMKNDTENDVQPVGRTTRQSAKIKNETKKPVQNVQISKKPQVSPVKVKKENVETDFIVNCEVENRQQDYDGMEGESDDEFPARDSDNEDWPSQETLNEFPKEIIKDGLLQVKGKELMSLICRFYNLECRLCDEKRRFKQLNDLLCHYNNVHKEEGYVECCQAKFTRYPAIIMHMARHLQPDAFKCNECGYIVTRPRFLQSHKQTHLPDDQKPYACAECPRRFCWKSALRIHLITHKPASERRQYICHICDRTYDTPGGLSTHKKLAHSGTKPPQSNVCHICAKNFSTRTGLHEHMMTIHQPREKGQMQCTECGKWLMNLRCLKTHMILHSDVEFRCDKCDYVTKKKVLLNRHLVTQHSNVRPYVCDYCGRDFKMKRALTVHVAQHGSTTKYQCPFCDRSFNSSTNFYTHRKNSHPKELAEMKRQEEAERRRKRIEAGVEEGEIDDSDADRDIVQPIEIQEEDDDDDESTTFELRDTHLILTTNTGEEYTVLEVKSHDNHDSL